MPLGDPVSHRLGSKDFTDALLQVVDASLVHVCTISYTIVHLHIMQIMHIMHIVHTGSMHIIHIMHTLSHLSYGYTIHHSDIQLPFLTIHFILQDLPPATTEATEARIPTAFLCLTVLFCPWHGMPGRNSIVPGCCEQISNQCGE